MNSNAGMNPFLPFDTYIPDGEPKVFGGRLYLYGSYDRFGSGYCSKEYHVVSAPLEDLTSWTDHGVSFSTADVPWSNAVLYAPDVLEKDGTYYLYFCLSDGSEGVAESDSPAGPFRNARRITLGGEPISGIDPSVLLDGGRVYYTWGQMSLKMGELNDDLCTLKPETVREGVLSKAPGREGFHEGSSLRKLGEKFCLIYASEYAPAYPNNGSRPTKLDYAVADSPYGPYERRGTVIDNTGCDPSSWNNHGSVIRAGDDWFVFYHASTNNTEFSRRARVERLKVDEASAVIEQAVPSSNGFLTVLCPRNVVSPVNACRFFGGAYLTEKNGGFPVVALGGGAGFAFSPVSFDAGDYEASIRYRAEAETTLRLLLGETLAAKAVLPPGEGEREITFSSDTKEATVPLRFAFDGEANACEVYGLTVKKA